jgi:class 3 adenylate cyclase
VAVVFVEANQTCPIPDDPVLAEVAVSIRDSHDWAWIVDRDWRLQYMTDEHRASFAAGMGMIPIPLGAYLFGPEMAGASARWITGLNRPELWGPALRAVGGLMLSDAGAHAERLRDEIDPALRGLFDELSPTDMSATSFLAAGTYLGSQFSVVAKAIRIRDADGQVRGTLFLFQPAVGMGVVGAMAFALDPGHLQRMASVARPNRTPAAVLFADLEGSSVLSRTLSTANYFALGRRIVRATDQCVVDAGGLVGRHVGDGIVAFFPSAEFASESDAAKACIATARTVRDAMTDVATRSGLAPDELVMRFGLHWGSTIHIGNITTAARFEVTALGDEVNEAARIESCATGGRTLVSKALVERLDDRAAAELDVDRDRVTYTQLADLGTATEKARRDAPAIAVCEL